MRTIHLSRAALEPWAILPQSLSVIVEIVTRHFSGEKLDAEEVQTRINGGKRPSDRVYGDIAVLPLFGTIFPRANMFTEVSGATSAEMFGKRFMALVDDPSIGAIVLDVDSPGGQASGIEELSNLIFEARGKKPIVAVANHLMASAAYWIGTAADELVVTPSGQVGSIGAFAMHEDISASLEKEGIKISLISEGKYKVEGNPYEPLLEEARGALQSRVREVYDQFVSGVARNRGASEADVRTGYGEGRVVSAQPALRAGMVDRVATLDEVIDGLLAKRMPGRAVQGGAVEEPVQLSGEMIVPPGKKDDDFEVITTEAATREAEEVDNKDEEAQNLRNYLDIFGPTKGGE